MLLISTNTNQFAHNGIYKVKLLSLYLQDITIVPHNNLSIYSVDMQTISISENSNIFHHCFAVKLKSSDLK